MKNVFYMKTVEAIARLNESMKLKQTCKYRAMPL